MNAKSLVQNLGTILLGQKVNTPAVGDYPGGVATVTQLAPDKKAPQIVFQVNLPGYGEMGVLEHEDVSLRLGGAGLPPLHPFWRN
jgi:hypothetical protein